MLKAIIKRILKTVATPFILGDYLKFRASQGSERFQMSIKDFHPQLFDKTGNTKFDRHYLYHPAWAARAVNQIKPDLHIDVSSILSFGTVLSAFVPVKFYDYRPANIELSNYISEQADLLALPFSDGSVESLSCMHTLEHVGLGRYGDPIDANGDLKAMAELRRVVRSGGHLLVVVPVGKPKIEYNAHRIYSYEQIIDGFSGFSLKEFALIPEKAGGLIYAADSDRVAQESYACGCFWFIKN